MTKQELKLRLNAIYGKGIIYADTDSIRKEKKMKIREHVIVDNNDIHKFLKEHRNDNICVEEIIHSGYKISFDREYTEPEFHMEVLHTFYTEHLHGELTMEEKNAIDYAIGAIKTLVDMGVLK